MAMVVIGMGDVETDDDGVAALLQLVAPLALLPSRTDKNKHNNRNIELLNYERGTGWIGSRVIATACTGDILLE